MPKRFYLDSNVLICLIREEIDPKLNARFLEAKEFFSFCRKENHLLLISSLFFREIETSICLKKETVIEEFAELKVKTLIAEKEPETAFAKKITEECRIHFSDAMHVAIAIENKAECIVTWNKKDFEKATRLIACFSPSEILDIP